MMSHACGVVPLCAFGVLCFYLGYFKMRHLHVAEYLRDGSFAWTAWTRDYFEGSFTRIRYCLLARSSQPFLQLGCKRASGELASVTGFRAPYSSYARASFGRCLMGPIGHCTFLQGSSQQVQVAQAVATLPQI